MAKRQRKTAGLSAAEQHALMLQYYQQLPTVAALFATAQDRQLMDFDKAASDALDLLDALLLAIEEGSE